MITSSEIKPKYYLIFWLNNGRNTFNVKPCFSENEMEIEVEKLKYLDYEYLVSENIDNKKFDNGISEYKILNRGKYPSIKRLRFLSGFILFLILLYFIILFYNRLN